jgi:hypothetical protein
MSSATIFGISEDTFELYTADELSRAPNGPLATSGIEIFSYRFNGEICPVKQFDNQTYVISHGKAYKLVCDRMDDSVAFYVVEFQGNLFPVIITDSRKYIRVTKPDHKSCLHEVVWNSETETFIVNLMSVTTVGEI